jgi:hypothetical protein
MPKRSMYAMEYQVVLLLVLPMSRSDAKDGSIISIGRFMPFCMPLSTA